MEPAGLRAIAVSLFTASPEARVDGNQVRILYGDVDAIRWDLATLPSLDVRVLVLNSSRLNLPVVDVKVSVYVGKMAAEDAPALEAVKRGMNGVTEDLFYEATFEIEHIAAGSLGVLEVPGIRLKGMVVDLIRQKLFPSYVWVEATISEPTGEVHLVDKPVSKLLKMVPSRR